MQLIVRHASGGEVRYPVTTESELVIRNEGVAEAFSLDGVEAIVLELSHFDEGVETAGEEYARLNPQTRAPVASGEPPEEYSSGMAAADKAQAEMSEGDVAAEAAPVTAEPKKFWRL